MTRQRLAVVLLVVAAVGAAIGGASVLLALGDVDGAHRTAEIWRGWGLLFFAGLFVVLARTPSAPAALWWLVVANKAALAVSMGVAGEPALAVTDAVLAALVLVAYVLSQPDVPEPASGTALAGVRDAA